MNELALFAGAGGGILGGKLLGWRCICAVEIDKYARNVLMQRQNEGHLQPFPIWDDIRTFDGKPWSGKVDVISGGFPCQDISSAGKGAGITGERSGLWREMARVVSEVRPKYVWVENSPMLVSRGLTTVLSDLAKMGYDAKWGIVGAHHAGACHKRDRIWILAYALPSKQWRYEWKSKAQANAAFAYPNMSQCERRSLSCGIQEKHNNIGCSSWWEIEPELGRVANGVADRVDRLKAIGNGQVPAVVKLAFNLITK